MHDAYVIVSLLRLSLAPMLLCYYHISILKVNAFQSDFDNLSYIQKRRRSLIATKMYVFANNRWAIIFAFLPATIGLLPKWILRHTVQWHSLKSGVNFFSVALMRISLFIQL